ncbi:hypothetical protein CERZMDRAFT_109138 [Cercospora zeae-maydis SCOH1-5]|uniref:TRUD domain-containing protein n=1 Tax=Cercospora zeae-maydis SCOH1-5 TaxID=717836 RepID=A0A6A6FSN8_9PEZI|nr:hypothetical protein CERZMDRAFT_109138 [Cercospora zeae-maydis SCOH1-5]
MVTPPTSDRDQHAQELAVGIKTFVRPDVPGFSCILKQRYTDFLVNEVLPDGRVLHLVANEPDPDRKRKRQDDGGASQKKVKVEGSQETTATIQDTPTAIIKLEDATAKKEQAIASISDADRVVLVDVFGEDTKSAIINLYASVVAFPDRKPREHPTVDSPPIEEKSKRTEAHLCVRRIFDSKLETITVQDREHQSGPGTVIAIKAAPPRSNANGNAKRDGDKQRGKQDWAELGGEYLHFSLYKENKDTMEVLYFIASQLKVNMKHFGFAGTKDRRGVTVQRVSVHRVLRGRLEAVNKQAKGWRVGGPWEYKSEALTLGMSNGNQFLLTLRDAHIQNESESEQTETRLENIKVCAEAAAKSLGETGFLNYYGLQRFGTHSTGTHAVGMKILQGDLKGAVDSILAYDEALLRENQPSANGAESNGTHGQQRKVPQDDINRATAIHAFRKSGSSSEALSILQGNRFSAEKGMITHLGKKDRKTGRRPNENDFQGALMTIQRNLRLMYVHAYQSFVWNTVAGKRWELYGSTVVEGDLVVVGEKDTAEGLNNGASTKEEVDEHGEPIIHPSASTDPGNPGATGELDDPFVRARALSKEEAESGRYNIFDIVLPLPGYDVIYPKNELGKVYVDFMASEEGGKLNPYDMRRTTKDFSLSGGYRKMMARPLGAGVEVEVKAYSSPEEQLVETDLDKLRKAGSEQHQDSENSNGKQGVAGDKDKIAVILKLQLGSSQYATMALRELTKGAAMGFTPNYSVANR